MALDNLQISYLIDPAFQIENLAGKPAVGGSICVFEAGTDTKVITYQDFDGTENPFKIPLHADGRAVILADPSKSYDLYVYDSFNNLMFSRLNVTPNLSGNINITGNDVVIYNTDGTLDITQQSIQNNVRRYEINTKHKSFGVQEPLYFIEDSDSATIIGCRSQSSDYATTAYVEKVISGKLDISSYSSQSGNFLTDKFEYDNSNHITAYNNSAFAGTEYEAGDNIDITNNRISVTGLPTDIDVENAISSAVTNVENKFEYNDNNYITAYNNSAFAGKEYSAGDYVSIENDTFNVTGLQPSGDYATHDDLTAYQPSGDYATKEDVESATSGKMDVTGMTAYQPSGDYATHDDLTAYQPAGDYYSASNPSGFITNDAITGLQPSGDYVTHDEMTAYQPSGNYATLEDVESAVSGKQDTLSAGEGIQIIDNTISVTAQGGSGITAVNHDNTLSGNGNSEPLGLANAEAYVKQDDLTGYQPSGDYYSASNPSGFITSDDLTGYATTSLVSSVSSELYSAISGISGDFELVAGSGVELVDDPDAKTTTINVTAQGGNAEVETEVIAHSANWNTVGDKLDTTAFSDVSGSFLTAVPDTYLQNTDLEISDNKITGISGVPLAAGGGGGDVPEGVMAESALEYNAVNEISGYNGSAIAQYGAEKQWLVHDDTIVSISNSAQYAFGCNISALQRLMGIDETVLYSNTAVSNNIVLNEACTNFNRLRLKIYSPQSTGFVSYHEIEPKTNELWFARQCMIPAAQYKLQIVCEYFTANNAQNYTFVSGCRWYGNNNVAGGDTTTNLTGASLKDSGYITEIIGIGRKA